MSSRSSAERYHVEKVLGMSGDFVLDFTGAMFGAVFKQHYVKLMASNIRSMGLLRR